jgi:hypothetical protein
VAAAQVPGVRALAETSEVDHARDSLLARHAGEGDRAGALTGAKVLGSAPANRVDQVIGRVDPAAGAAQRLRT